MSERRVHVRIPAPHWSENQEPLEFDGWVSSTALLSDGSIPVVSDSNHVMGVSPEWITDVHMSDAQRLRVAERVPIYIVPGGVEMSQDLWLAICDVLEAAEVSAGNDFETGRAAVWTALARLHDQLEAQP